jgi:hypothetical protein
MNKYTYKTGETVRLGDRVELRSFFIFRDPGTVIYIPGVSRFHEEMKEGPIEYIGIKLDGAATGAATIDPATRQVLHVRFLERGTHEPKGELDPNQEIFESRE